MKTVRFVVVVLALAFTQWLYQPSLLVQAASSGCTSLNSSAVHTITQGTNVSLYGLSFQAGEVITATTELDTATRAQFSIADRNLKALVGPAKVPGSLSYRIPTTGTVILYVVNLASSNGTIKITIRCGKTGAPQTAPTAIGPTPDASMAAQVDPGSVGVVNDLRGRSLFMVSNNGDKPALIAKLMSGTPLTVTAKPVSANGLLWYRVRANRMEGWVLGVLTLDGKSVVSVVPYSEPTARATIQTLNSAQAKKADNGNLLARGLAYYSLKQYDLALADFAQVTKTDAKNVTGFYLQGLLRSEQKDTQTAIDNLTRAITLSAQDAVLYNLRGTAYVDLKQA